MSENGEKVLCLKRTFVLLLEESMKKRAVGEEGETTVGLCDKGGFKREGSMQSPCVKQPKAIKIGDACYVIKTVCIIELFFQTYLYF